MRIKRENDKRRGETKRRDSGQTKINGRINFSSKDKNQYDCARTEYLSSNHVHMLHCTYTICTAVQLSKV